MQEKSSTWERRARVGVLIAGLSIAGLSQAAPSDKARIADLEAKLQRSLVLIDQLASRLNMLESVKAESAKAESSPPLPAMPTATSTASIVTTTPAIPVAPSAAEALDAQARRIDQLEQNIVQVGENAVKRRDIGLPLHGFADFGYAHTSKEIAGRTSGFALGNVDLYLTPEFGDRVKSIVELVFEFNERGDGVATDVERLQVGYTFDDALTLWAGRVHTPYGYWNTGYHHGAQISPSILRPRLIAFEDQGGILPSHSVGLMASGSVRTSGGRVGYDAFLANGSRIVGDEGDKVLDYNAGKDDNNNKAAGGTLRFAFDGALDGLTLGVHALNEEIDEVGTARRTKLAMTGGYFAVDRDGVEAIGEYYRFRNKDLSGGGATHASWAGFVHAGWALTPLWMPYLRYEKAVLDQTDNYFSALKSGRSYRRDVAGVRYNLNNAAVMKLELNRTDEQGGDGHYNEARAQIAIRF